MTQMEPAGMKSSMAKQQNKAATRRNRFEIIIQCGERRIKHVCAADEETKAVERMMRTYATSDPELVLVKRLGALPLKCSGSDVI